MVIGIGTHRGYLSVRIVKYARAVFFLTSPSFRRNYFIRANLQLGYYQSIISLGGGKYPKPAHSSLPCERRK